MNPWPHFEFVLVSFSKDKNIQCFHFFGFQGAFQILKITLKFMEYTSRKRWSWYHFLRVFAPDFHRYHHESLEQCDDFLWSIYWRWSNTSLTSLMLSLWFNYVHLIRPWPRWILSHTKWGTECFRQLMTLDLYLDLFCFHTYTHNIRLFFISNIQQLYSEVNPRCNVYFGWCRY